MYVHTHTLTHTHMYTHIHTHYVQGDAGDYQAAVEQLSASQMKPVAMQRWLQALKLCVSHLTEDFDLLVGATLVRIHPTEEGEREGVGKRGRGEEW